MIKIQWVFKLFHLLQPPYLPFETPASLLHPHASLISNRNAASRWSTSFARKLLDERPEPGSVSVRKLDKFSFVGALKTTKDLIAGRRLHGATVVSGLGRDVFVANTLVGMYDKCCGIGEARRAFDGIGDRDVVSWNVMLSCYLRRGLRVEAVELFAEMVWSGIRPDEFTLCGMMKSYAARINVIRGRAIHAFLVKLGYESDPFAANALVDMYAKVGFLEDAILAFWGISQPDTVAWNAVVAGCVHCEDHVRAMELIAAMVRSETRFDLFTFSSALKVCAELKMKDFGRELHGRLAKIGEKSDLFIDVGLINMYVKCEMVRYSKKVHSLMPKKSLIAWNAVISGHSQNGEEEEAIKAFSDMLNDGFGFNHTTLSVVLKSAATLQAISVCEQVHAASVKTGFRSNAFVANSLVSAYAKCGQVNGASRLFEECQTRDLAVFTSMAASYAQCDRGEEALKLYYRMQELRIETDSFLFSSLLNACANLSAWEQGKQVHVHVVKLGHASDAFTANSLVNMYAKCGSIADAERSFSEIPDRGMVSWSAMIQGLAQHGQGEKALSIFREMLERNVCPNHVTITSVLCACNHAGMVAEARSLFGSMKERHGIEPTQEHYACMVDLLGRAGMLNEATELAEAMPFEANASVWGALLNAARVHKDAELGRRSAEKLLALEPEKSGTLVILANVYASAGQWDDAAGARRLMRRNKVKKEPGMSWVEVRGAVHSFSAGDMSHARGPEIHAKLTELKRRIREAGYVPAAEFDLPGVDEDDRERSLWGHSERLAVAFGLLALPAGAAVRVMKNLRVCVDCHVALKFVSGVVSREIILRDVNRFHHFKDGSCSCRDYW